MGCIEVKTKKSGENPVIAAIDVGTNSVHMVVARIGAHGFHVLSSEKEVVRLGSGTKGMDHLTPEAIERAVSALSRMKQIADAHGADIRVVATSAVREASNASDFLNRARDEVGITVEVISGNEEARLIHLGVQQSLAFGAEPVLTVDIGGGSTEFCISVKGRLRFAQSLKVGAVRLTDAFVPDGDAGEGAVRRLRAHVASVIAPLAHEIREMGYSRVVVSSGTSETIARLIAHDRDNRLPLSMNGFSFSKSEFSSVMRKVLNCEDSKSRQELPGMDSKRSDIIVAGGVILEEVAKALRIESFEFSEYALREGVLVDTAQHKGLLDADAVDAGLGSVLRLAERCSVDMVHSGHVAMLSRKILTLVSRKFDVDASLGRLMEAAALLANVGNAVAYSKHHHHSYYIIRNADLMGFTDEEIEVIALTARYHRKSAPKPSHADFARMSVDRQHDIELMAGIIRIATGLDRSHDQSVEDVSMTVRNDVITFVPRHTGGTAESAALNVFAAQERVGLLQEFLGGTVSITS